MVVGEGAASFLLFAAAAALLLARQPTLGATAAALGAYFLLAGAGMLSYGLRGELEMREELQGAIPWRGDEGVLDVGCGRGRVGDRSFSRSRHCTGASCAASSTEAAR
jgi:hypothetical protein